MPACPRPRWVRRLAICLAGFAVFLVVAVVAAGYFFGPYAVIVPGRLERTMKYHGRMPADLGLNGERFDVEVEPDLWLRGWFLRTAGTPEGTVILLHGHGSCKESDFPLAKMLAEHGYNSIVYDSRGHGESGGKYCTFGYYEHQDCSHVLDEAERRFGPLGPVAVQGASFGGAVALQTLAVDHRFRCGISESTFATLREVVRSDARGVLHFSWHAPVDSALRRAGEIAHFPAESISPERAAADIECPVLIIHGTADQRIPLHDGERIFHSLKSPGCEWYAVTGAGHGGVWNKDPAEYERRVLGFLALYEH